MVRAFLWERGIWWGDGGIIGGGAYCSQYMITKLSINI
jgi:hypothetical protein